MTIDSAHDEVRPHSWADAFPWLSGASGAGAVDWWNETIDATDAATRRSRLARVSSLAMERLTRWTIGEIFPGLPSDLDVQELDLPVRARNALGKYGRSKPGRLQAITLDDMLAWHQMGVGTADAILQTLADLSTSAATPTIRASVSRQFLSSGPVPGSQHPGWVEFLAEDLTRIATWYSTVGQLDQPLISGEVGPGMPDEIIKACERIKSLRVGDIFDEEEAERDIAVLFNSALGVLDMRAIEVLQARLFADDPATLDQIGQKYDVTRERIRQIEGKARGTMLTVISEEGPLAMAAETARDLIGTIRPLNDLLEMIPALGNMVEQVGQPAWRVLDRLDDAYEIEDGWCVVPTMSTARELTRTQLAERTNQYGVIRLDELDLVESSRPDRRPDLTASWLTHCGYIISGEYVLTRTASVGDYAAAVLFLEGSPLSPQEIVDRFAFDRSARSVGNALGDDDRFERVDRDRWALKEWGMEAYTGIRSIIRELVANAVEGDPKLLQQMRGRHRRQPHIPFQAIDQGGVRQVGRPDIGGVESGVTPQQPGFRMQPGAVGLVVDPHLRAELVDQRVQGAGIRRTQVGGGDDPQRHTTLPQLGEFTLQQPQALPFHERAQQVHPVGTGHLGPQLCGQRRLMRGIGHQRRVGKRRRGAWKLAHTQCLRGDGIQPANLCRILLVQVLGERLLAAQHLKDPAQQLRAGLGATRHPQLALNDRGEMPRDRQRLLGVVDRTEVGVQIGPQRKRGIKSIGQQRFV